MNENELVKNNNETYQEGDIIYTSWGYDQTNVEWYKVLKRIGKSSILVVELAGTCEETGSMSGTSYPGFMSGTSYPTEDMHEGIDGESKPFKVRVNANGICNMDPGSNGYQRNGYKYDKLKNEGHFKSWYA